MSRRDDVSALYKPSKILDKICVGLFCADVCVSLCTTFTRGKYSSYITTGLIIIALFYMVLSIYDDGVLWFRAESARRKNSIQVAYNVRLDEYETVGYYNNSIEDPDLSYAVNQFESAFFTKEISAKMCLKAGIKALLAIAVVVASCRLIVNDELLLVVVQSAFSALVIEDSIRLFLYQHRIKTLYNEAYHEFVTIGISKPEQLVWLHYFCTEYESIKAHYRVRLDETLFNKMNPSLSSEWTELYKQIRIAPEIISR